MDASQRAGLFARVARFPFFYKKIAINHKSQYHMQPDVVRL